MKNKIIYLISAFAILVPTIFSGQIYAIKVGPGSPGGTTPSGTNCTNYSQAKCSACAGVAELGGSQNCNSKGSAVNSLISTIVSLMSYILGALAIIMIIVSGFKFITAGGNTNSVESAKKTLIFALIGLVIAVMAQLVVHLVINASTKLASVILHI